MNKHTPGPWIVGTHLDIESESMPTWKDVWPDTSSEGRIPVCKFRGPDRDAKNATLLSETNIANARLIAAAPELLEWLKGESCVECGGDYEFYKNRKPWRDCCATRFALIAKAEGREAVTKALQMVTKETIIVSSSEKQEKILSVIAKAGGRE